MEKRRGLVVRRDAQLNVDRHAAAQHNKKAVAADNAVVRKRTTVDNTNTIINDSTDEPEDVVEVETCKVNVKYGGTECMITREAAAEIDVYIKNVERWRRLDVDFLKNTVIDSRMRAILLDWVVQIQSKFRLSAETFYLACALIDRVVKPLNVTRKNFQLIGLACIYIASKFEEVLLPNVHDFVYMGGDICTIEALFRAEQQVLRTMHCQLSFAYPNHFLRKLRFYMPSDHSTYYEISKMFVDIAIMDYKTCWWLPSEIAATAVQLAYAVCRRPCPIGLPEVVDVTASAATAKAAQLAARVPSYLDREGKLQGLRMKYKGSSTIDKIVASLPYLKARYCYQ